MAETLLAALLAVASATLLGGISAFAWVITRQDRLHQENQALFERLASGLDTRLSRIEQYLWRNRTPER